MCGIYGQINVKTNVELARKCMKLIKHRGPDGEGIYEAADEGVLLGHCRLSVLDLSDSGKQPMTCCGGRYVITYNGELYNYLEIRTELEKNGYTFESESDTEVIPAAYDAWGEKCLERFNGMWAFVIYDRVEKDFFASRDRFGVKPFFYACIDSGIIFASEMKAILPHFTNPQIDYDTVFGNYMMYSATDRSLIKGIKRLPAGHSMLIGRDGSIEVKQWWSTLDNIPSISNKYEENVEMFRELFIDACRLRMRSDVTLGTALSGGLDSSATICAMNKIVKEGTDDTVNHDMQHAFVASFPGTSLDETLYAKKVADYLDIKASYVNVDTTIEPTEFENMLFQFEEIYNTSPVPMMRLYKAVKDNGVTVTLDGHGADELFGGYAGDFYAAFPDAGLNIKKISSIFDALYDMYPHDGGALDTNIKRYDWNLYIKSWKNWAWLERHPDAKGELILESNNFQWKKLSSFNKRLYRDTHKSILPTLLRNYDNYSMVSGVEIRMPFLDYRIATMAFALQWDAKIRNGYSKSIIRDAMVGLMPREVSHRKTNIGFNTPIAEWMQGSMKEYFADIISSLDCVNSSTIEYKNVNDIFQKMWKKETVSFADAQEAYTALAPYLWEKCFFRRMLNY